MAMESSVLVQPKRPDWHKHEQMQIHHTKSKYIGYMVISNVIYLVILERMKEKEKEQKEWMDNFGVSNWASMK